MEDIISEITGFNEPLQVLLIVITSFISEDLAVILSASSYFMGAIKQHVFSIGIYLGIILSDSLIYIIGRILGHNRDKLFFIDIKLLRKQAEQYSAQSFSVLIITRFTPGLRSPSLFAAGLAKYNFKKFLIAKSISVILMLAIIEFFGTFIISFISDNKLYLALFFISLTITSFIIFKIHTGYGFKSNIYNILKYKYYEFWPAIIFYLPITPYYLWLGLKYRDLLLPIYANPAIKYGGLICERKSDIQNLFNPSENYHLKTTLINSRLTELEKITLLDNFTEENNITYPIVIKLNIGQRGNGVKIINNYDEAKNVIKNTTYDIIVQEFCDHENEIGIFFYYNFKTNNYNILSITEKITPQLVGDGKSRVKDLILNDKRAKYISKIYFNQLKEEIFKIPPKGEIINLSNIGNHARGCIFKDGKHLNSPELVKIINNVCQDIEGLYIGRFDIKYKSLDSLMQGLDFKIIELNGSGAEATHIYDRNIKLSSAYKSLAKQWKLIFEHGKYCKDNNLKQNNIDIDEFARDYFNFLKTSRNYKDKS